MLGPISCPFFRKLSEVRTTLKILIIIPTQQPYLCLLGSSVSLRAYRQVNRFAVLGYNWLRVLLISITS